MKEKIGVGLYGMNGHQVHALLASHPGAELVAVAGFPMDRIGLGEADGCRQYDSLEAMLGDSRVALVSLCSPRRADQAADAIRCLRAGRHVYAEKPCALSEKELDEILRVAAETGCQFHEMAGTAFEEPWYSLRRLVLRGEIGEVVQVFCQKSYPLGGSRPHDEAVDGGLLCQVGIHAFRFVEHVACRRIVEVEARQTRLGSGRADVPGELHTAASYLMRLEGGGVASVLANYLNPPTFGTWGNEHVRIFGTRGFVEATDAGTKTRLVLNERDCGPLPVDISVDAPGAGKRYFDAYIDSLLGQGEMPISLEEELHPLRMVLRARASAEQADTEWASVESTAAMRAVTVQTAAVQTASVPIVAEQAAGDQAAEERVETLIGGKDNKSGFRHEPDPRSSGVAVRAVDGSHPDFRRLVAQLDRELYERNGEQQAQYDQFNGIDKIKNAAVAYLDGLPSACGAIKLLEADTAELKRMFVHPCCRRMGLASQVLAFLEQEALAQGCRTMLLETGVNQFEAIALYAKSGYRRMENYGPYAGNPGSLCMRKVLSGHED